ncbi:MAG: tRNA (adenosine(37)-N6)-threonylcarbamoyltransferase complex dimerization subunit type 1 TsaB [Chromatiales bacterium]|mgnify:FL=1|nr:tRNA (adenosine(37)-N6)-threonylcarbamoyltransferase complex dimerization subunit type 1 TsaB [Chromatiales bacterium]
MTAQIPQIDTPFTALAIETATALSTVAVCHEGYVHSCALSGKRPGAGEVYAKIDGLLTKAGISPPDLECIAFGCGPGGFTGVRIAAAVAQGLAYGLQIPVFRYSTLGLLAVRVGVACEESLVIAAGLDARQGEAYVGFYRIIDGRPEALVPDALVTPGQFSLNAFAEQHEVAGVFLAGPAWSVYPDLLNDGRELIVADSVDCLPLADDLLSLARHAFVSGDLSDAFAAQPNYLRDNVTY